MSFQKKPDTRQECGYSMSEFLDPSEEIEMHGAFLPHWQQTDSLQFVTFRLGDAMPKNKLEQWREEYEMWLPHHPKPWSAEESREYRKRFVWSLEEWLDEGAGSCLLENPVARRCLEETLRHDEGTRVEHQAWVIMPNHVHLFFRQRERLEVLLKSWKGISARKIGQRSIWQKGYRDTMIRSERHFANVVRYIRRNPAKLRAGTFTLWQSERALAVDDVE